MKRQILATLIIIAVPTGLWLLPMSNISSPTDVPLDADSY